MGKKHQIKQTVKKPNSKIQDTVIFNYSQEYLGVASTISEENLRQGLFDCQVLEVLKM